jgi:NAD(P)H-hydrate epimerase
MKLLTVNQMRSVEKESDAKGTSYAELMENAGRGLADLVRLMGEENGWSRITALVGTGNNGGDALVALAYLAESGWHTRAYLLNRKSDDLLARYLDAGGEIAEAANDRNYFTLRGFLNESDAFLDGLLGTGIKLPLKSDAAHVLQNAHFIMSEMDLPPYVIAVDCPSGINCDTGEAAPETIPADTTVTMAAVKQGMLKLPAFELIGKLEIVDIGLPAELDSWKTVTTSVADWDTVSTLLPERTSASHKGTFGTAFVMAGSTSYTGAALLAGTAAYRIGAGLVTMAVPEPLHAALAGHLPEATWVLLPHEHGFLSSRAGEMVLINIGRATAFLAGPGLGTHVSTRNLIENMISTAKLPMVIDADGLRHLSMIENWHKKLFTTAVLTPHPGEMSALTGLSVAEIQGNRVELAAAYAKEWGHVVVLKGAFTVVASPDGQSTIIPVATPALARAGTGDVLAGLIVGLRAQGLDAGNAAIAGAFIHAQSGIFAAEKLETTASVLASDVLNSVSDVLAELGN